MEHSIYHRNALRNVDYQLRPLIPFGSGNFPTRLTNGRNACLCAHWQENRKRFIQVRSRVQDTFSDLAHPQQMCQRHIDKDAPFLQRSNLRTTYSAARCWHTTKPLDGCFVEVTGQIRACIEGFRDYIRPTTRWAFLCIRANECIVIARVFREF